MDSVTNNSLLQESSACADTCSLMYYVNRNLCASVHAHTHKCPCAKTRYTDVSPPFFFSVFLLHHSTPPEAKPAFLFIRPSLCLFIPCSFLPTPLPCFSTSFCSGCPKHERRQNVNARLCVEAHMVAVVLAAISQLMFSR